MLSNRALALAVGLPACQMVHAAEGDARCVDASVGDRFRSRRASADRGCPDYHAKRRVRYH